MNKQENTQSFETIANRLENMLDAGREVCAILHAGNSRALVTGKLHKQAGRFIVRTKDASGEIRFTPLSVEKIHLGEIHLSSE